METLLVCLLAGYGVWLAAYLLWEKRQSERPTPQTDVARPKRRDNVPDIVGKSGFRMKPPTPKPIIPTPQTITPSETESAEEKASTFAPDADNRRPAQLTEAELDAAFEHLEIPDVPLELRRRRGGRCGRGDAACGTPCGLRLRRELRADRPSGQNRLQYLGDRCGAQRSGTGLRADRGHGAIRPSGQ